MRKYVARLLYCFTILAPWGLRRRLLQFLYDYKIAPTARIGLSWIRPEQLIMGEHSQIGNFTTCTGLSLLELKDSARIGNRNKIFGPRLGTTTDYAHRERLPALIVGTSSAITHEHIFDCTDTISIGQNTTIAGHRSQFLSHSVDLRASRQDCEPITIGHSCFIGTSAIILKGATLPDRSVLGAGSVLNKTHDNQPGLYWGVPATRIDDAERYAKWFDRSSPTKPQPSIPPTPPPGAEEKP